MKKTNKKAVSLLVAISIFIGLGTMACGESDSSDHVHVVTNMIEEVPATCTQTGIKAHGNCDGCGALVIKDGTKLVEATEADLVIEKTPHAFEKKIVSDEYLISEATADTPQTFAKACACGLKSDSESDRYTVGKTLNEYAKEADIIQDILLRITPGVEAHTHDFIKTGQIDSKFGCAIKTGAADEITKKALELENINLCGFHCHIGSQIFEKEPLEKLVADGQLMSYIHKGFWQCMDSMREKLMLEKLLEVNKAPWKKWDSEIPIDKTKI